MAELQGKKISKDHVGVAKHPSLTGISYIWVISPLSIPCPLMGSYVGSPIPPFASCPVLAAHQHQLLLCSACQITSVPVRLHASTCSACTYNYCLPIVPIA